MPEIRCAVELQHFEAAHPASSGPLLTVDPGPVLFVGNPHRRIVDLPLQLLPGDVGVEAELEEQLFVVEPRL